MKDKFYITTPIYYVNAEPHIGHAYTTVLADVITGYRKLFGQETYFLTGLDEHGQKVQDAASEAGVLPQEHCNRMSVRYQDLWKKLKIDNNDFIRTTEDRHKKVVREVLKNIFDKGEIYHDEFTGWYCVPDERFFMDKDLADGNCPLCGRQVQQMREKNYFFRMSKYQDWLIKYIQDHSEFILPEFRRNEVLGFLKNPLKDLCISRPKSRLSWGIQLPFDENYVTYVWFDALLNYYSAVHDKNLWPATVHLMGKDIITTHSVYWPIMLKAAGLELPRTIFAHGWWLVDNEKMSKSLGNVVKPLDLADKYGVDSFRYFLMREMVPGNDASFSESAMVNRINSDLANDFGNLLSRITTLIHKFFEGKVPAPYTADMEWHALAENSVTDLKNAIANFRVDEAVKAAWVCVNYANYYLEEKAPWKLAKADKSQAGTVLYYALEGLRLSAVALKPIMPDKCLEALKRMKAEDSGLNWGELRPGTAIESGRPLFPRLEPILEDKTKLEAAKEKIENETINIEEFRKIHLRVAQVINAERIDGADKLLKLTVNLGNETRTIVAGIAKHYMPVEMVGKKIIVAANLEKAKIRGIESQGMLLAASYDDTMKLLTVDGDLPAGAKIS